MKQLLLGGVSLSLHLYFFLSFGSLFIRIRKREEQFRWCFAPVMGLFIYYGLFEILALPMTLLQLPLHLLTMVWGILLIIVGTAAVFLCGRMWWSGIKRLGSLVMRNKVVSFLFLLLILIQVLYAAVYSLNSADAAFYVGNVSTSLYTDTLGRYNPYTGELYKKFLVRYVTAAYYLDHTVFCQALGIHPMVQMKTVVPVINLFLANLLYYSLGMQLLGGNRKKAVFFCWAVFFFGILGGNTSVSGFMFSRTFEGKAMLHGLVIPLLFTAFLQLYQKKEDKEAYWRIFFASLGGICLTTSSMTVVPAAVAAGTLAAAVKNRSLKMVGKAFLCVLPDIAVLALYLLVQMGLVTLYAA